MSMLFERMSADLKNSLKARNVKRVNVLRYILAQIHNREIEKRGTGNENLTDGDILEVLSKEVKKRKDAIDLFKKGKRDDLVLKEEEDLVVMGEYMPPPVSRKEIEEIISEIQKAGISDFNSLMKESMKRLKGRADGRLVGEIVKEKTEGK